MWVMGCLVSIGLLSCNALGTRNFPIVDDGGFLSGDPCGAPCFWGISPGVTSENQVAEILKGKGMPPSCTTIDDKTKGWRGFSCPAFGIPLDDGTGLVRMIGFKPSARITVGDAISKYGEPNALTVTSVGIPEQPKVAMSLFYDRIRMILGLKFQEEFGPYALNDSTQIQGINYYDESSYASQIKNAKWKGYGLYDISQ